MNDMTCKQVDHIDASPGTTIYADETLTMTAVLGTSGNVAPDNYTWLEVATVIGDGPSITLSGLQYGTHYYSVEATCSALSHTSSASTTITVEPVKVTDISISPGPPIYVGDAVTFTAIISPAGHNVDTLLWEVFLSAKTDNGDGTYSLDESVEASGTGNPWTYTPQRATRESGNVLDAHYSIRATFSSGGFSNYVQKDFDVEPYIVAGIAGPATLNEGSTATYSAVTNPGGAGSTGLTYAWHHTRTSAWGSSDDPDIQGSGKTVSHVEIDPGVWQVMVHLNSGGYVTTATHNVTIEPATVAGFTCTVTSGIFHTFIREDCSWTSSTGDPYDLDHSWVGRKMTWRDTSGDDVENPFDHQGPGFFISQSPNPFAEEQTGDETPGWDEFASREIRPPSGCTNATSDEDAVFLDIEWYARYDDGRPGDSPETLAGPDRATMTIFIRASDLIPRIAMGYRGQSATISCDPPPSP